MPDQGIRQKILHAGLKKFSRAARPRSESFDFGRVRDGGDASPYTLDQTFTTRRPIEHNTPARGSLRRSQITGLAARRGEPKSEVLTHEARGCRAVSCGNRLHQPIVLR